jgi:GTP cyclohydrolase I
MTPRVETAEEGADPAVGHPIDGPRIEAAVREILLAIGEDPDREGLRRTPARVAAAYAELFAGLREDPRRHLGVTFDEGHKEMVVLRDVPFASTCEHHLLPFTGHAHVAYIPQGRVAGLSKLARLVEGYARRPQVQERLTSEIADALMEELQPDGCGVVVEAVHTCMTIRGIQKPGATMITSAVRGGFRRRPETRAEFFAIVRGGRA